MKIRAFSLIELMVVIAIVAVLAAVAVPAYVKYKTKAEITPLFTYIDTVKKQAVEYYYAHGYFPNADNLAIGTGLDPTQVNTAPYNDPKLVAMQLFPYDQGGPVCPHGVNIFVSMTGIEYNGASPTQMDIYIFEMDGQIKQLCQYYGFDINLTAVNLDDFFPGCINGTDDANKDVYGDMQAAAGAQC